MTAVRFRHVPIALSATLMWLAVACGDSAAPAETPRSLTGSWGATGATFTSFALTEDAGKVTGLGWTAGSRAVAVEGTHSGQDVTLTLYSRAPSRALLHTFNGRLQGTSLVGEIFNGSFVPIAVSLVRVDTVAESFGRFVFAGALTAVDSGNASFSLSGGELQLVVGSSGRGLYVYAPPRRLAPGTYALGVRGSGALYGGIINNGASGGVNLGSVNGELKVHVSTRRALIGTVRIDAMDTMGRAVTATATFSASCFFAATAQAPNCQPDS
jgi:hypothetical protein